MQTCSGHKLRLKCLLNFERQCGVSAAVLKEKGLCSIAIRANASRWTVGAYSQAEVCV